MPTVSSLSSGTYLAYSGNYSKGRNGMKICKFTPHIMAGILTAQQCGVNIFQKPGRQASSNYGIGNAGEIGCYVYEEDRAWTSSNGNNDRQAITVEVSNCEYGGQWRISDAAWNSLVNLGVDVCRRYGFRLNFTGNANGSLTYHSMFASTTCPGPYLKSRMQELADTVNKKLDGGTVVPVPAPSIPTSGRNVGDVVTINGIYTASNSTKKLNPARNSGTITKIINGAHNPYLLDNGNLGWTNDGCIVGSSGGSSSSGKSITEVANEVIAGKWGNGTDRQAKLESAGYNYSQVQSEVNRILGVGGGSSTPAPSSSEIKKGDKVKVLNNVDYNGTRLMSSVKGRIYDVIQVSGDRVVIGKGSAVTAAMKKSTLQKV